MRAEPELQANNPEELEPALIYGINAGFRNMGEKRLWGCLVH